VSLDFSMLCLRHIPVNLVLANSDNPGQGGCIVWDDLMKLLSDNDTLLLLTCCQNPGHKFSGNTMHHQFSNLLACRITNSDLISKVSNGSTSILTNELLKYGYSVGCCGADKPTCVLVILNECPTGLNRAGHSNTRVQLVHSSPNMFPIIVRVSIALFPRFVQNLIHTRCSFVKSIMKLHRVRYTSK
jgi:hypothetical protein